MRHIIPISGKDSLCTAIVQIAIDDTLPYEFVFNPTGAEFPIVFEWLNNVEEQLGIKIIHVGEDLDAIIQSNNYFLPSRQARYCTRQSKIEPFVKWINGEDAIAYYGIRADEQREGFNNTTSKNILPAYPLQKMNIGIKQVYQILNSKGLKPPTFFWDSVYNRVCNILNTDVNKLIPEWQFDILFAWRTRANCYFCFNQRRYEFVGLLEYYPELFDKAESYEYKGGDNPFYWLSDYPLKKIRENAEKIKDKRAYQIAKIISPNLQYELFDDEFFLDELDVKSCGLFCGK